jgi:hypothetical protein
VGGFQPRSSRLESRSHKKNSCNADQLPWKLDFRKKMPFPGFDTRKGQGDRARVFEAQLAACLWPYRINRSALNPTPPDQSLFLMIKILAAR